MVREAELVDLPRIASDMPGSAPRKIEKLRAKVFKSGNSLAVRIPAGTKLVAGTEMDLTIEDGERLSLRPVDAPKRKFNVEKVWGCAIGSGLRPIDPDDRWFEERPLLWDDPDWRARNLPDG